MSCRKPTQCFTSKRQGIFKTGIILLHISQVYHQRSRFPDKRYPWRCSGRDTGVMEFNALRKCPAMIQRPGSTSVPNSQAVPEGGKSCLSEDRGRLLSFQKIRKFPEVKEKDEFKGFHFSLSFRSIQVIPTIDCRGRAPCICVWAWNLSVFYVESKGLTKICTYWVCLLSITYNFKKSLRF